MSVKKRNIKENVMRMLCTYMDIYGKIHSLEFRIINVLSDYTVAWW